MITRICLLSLCLALAGCCDIPRTASRFDLGAYVTVIGMACTKDWALYDYYSHHFSPKEAALAAQYRDEIGCRYFVGEGVVVNHRWPDALCVRPNGEINCLYVFADNVAATNDPTKCGQPAGHGVSYPECEPPRARGCEPAHSGIMPGTRPCS